MKNPVIGILTNVLIVEEGPYIGGERIYVNRDYIKNVLKSGGIPLLLPIIDDIEIIQKQIEGLDGLILSGGQDVNPKLYGQAPSPFLGAVRDDRDFFEIHALQAAFARRIPILGVCRGMQLLNVAFGGTLHQDIPQELGFDHQQKHHRHDPCHKVEIYSDTLLHKILENSHIDTNSFHHQSVKDLASCFRINARSEDGVIEGIEHKEGFVLGVQWHPEMMVEKHHDMQKLFSALVAAAR